MNRRDARHDLRVHVACSVERKAGGDRGSQADSVDELHRHEAHAFCFAEIMDATDVAIRNASRHRDFAAPALELAIRADDLQRDRHCELLVGASPHRAAAARADAQFESIATRDQRTRCERWCDDRCRCGIRRRAGDAIIHTTSIPTRRGRTARATGRAGSDGGQGRVQPRCDCHRARRAPLRAVRASRCRWARCGRRRGGVCADQLVEMPGSQLAGRLVAVRAAYRGA